MNNYVYDVEVLPNFYSATFINIETNRKYQFIVSPFIDDREGLVEFLGKADTLVGYNSLSYDDPTLIVFLRAWKSGDKLNGVLYRLSGRLIAEGNWQDEKVREVRWSKRNWKSIDLMAIMAFDYQGVTLKQVAIRLGWHRIQDLPLAYDESITEDQIPLIMDYNMNDVEITLALYHKLQKERDLRDEINKLYGVDVTNASDSKMANILLEKFYTDRTHVNRRDLKDMKTNYFSFGMEECIPDNVVFQDHILQRLLAEMKQTKLIMNGKGKFNYEHELYYEGKIYQFGVGGLHSEDSPASYLTDDKYVIIDVDVSSYYPSVMINNRVKPTHLKDDLLDILQTIRDERLEAKHLGQKAKAEALKITVNSIFGKLGSDTFWLKDPKAMISVTVAGQLYLMMLVEHIIMPGIEVISANTDGIMCKVAREWLNIFRNGCQNWADNLGLQVEFNEYKSYYRIDVNNYIAQDSGGKVKERGIFVTEFPTAIKELKAAHTYPIVAKAMNKYFMEDIPYEDTLMDCQNILDFCISEKSGRQFVLEHHTRKGITELQRTNRFYISKKGGALWKRNIELRTITALYKGKYTTLMNDLEIKEMEDYGINYEFYLGECDKIVNAIRPRIVQMSFI